MSGVSCDSCVQSEATDSQVASNQGTGNASRDTATITPIFAEALKPGITIEFCDRCRWLHRATWIQTELLLTFPAPTLGSITLVPLNSSDTGGRFRVWLHSESERGAMLLWDRKSEGGFPELKTLKQRVRDRIDPEKSLGHSDKPAAK